MGFLSRTLFYLILCFSLLNICIFVCFELGFVSAVALCPCLASGGYWFILNLFKLLVLVFIMWLSLRLGFVICRLPILSDLILMCCFKMFLFCLLGLLCWSCACLSSVCICLVFSKSFHTHQTVCLIDIYLSLGWFQSLLL